MKQIIELADGVFAEVEDSGYKELSSKPWSGNLFEGVSEHIKVLSERLAGILDQIESTDKLDSIHVESSIKVGSKGSVFFVQGSSEAHFLVRFTFKRGDQ